MNTSKTKTGRPDLRVVPPASEELPAPTPITALVPPEIKSAVDALTHIQLGTGTLADLAEIALTVNNGHTEFNRIWFLEAVPEAVKELQDSIRDAVRANRWKEAAMLQTHQQDLFQRLQKSLTRNLPESLGEPD